MRSYLTLALCAILLGQVGCALVGEGGSVASSTMKSVRPRSKGYSDDNNSEYVDQWADTGVEARGDRPLDKESDPLTPYVSSPKARAIERSLGVE